ncbi:MAG: D-glucuronyl C5-epimerase family protein [Planctomycetota bacterium]
MRKLLEIGYMARDFVRVASGRDYFHAPQPLGPYFTQRGAIRGCYYNDLRRKADWTGATHLGAPIIYFPALGEEIAFPITVLQFGLGATDRWLLEGAEADRRRALDAVRWTLASLRVDGSLPNRFPELQPGLPFFSDNSGMACGEALSLLTRAITNRIVEGTELQTAELAVRRIADSLLAPIEDGGTSLHRGEEISFCELCRRDEHVILNGWIFALFGLRDYAKHTGCAAARRAYDQSVATLDRRASEYLLPDGWSLYDTHGRVASPFYHQLHIALLGAMTRLEPDASRLADVVARMESADSPLNRTRYTVAKAWRKLCERKPYATVGAAPKRAA